MPGASFLEAVQSLYNKYNKYIDTVPVYNVFGQHFYDCPWSKDYAEEGPDTCGCMMVYIRRNRLREQLESCVNCHLDVLSAHFPEHFVDWLRSDRRIHG